MSDIANALVRAFRNESSQILAALMMYTSDIELVEDVLQDAFVQAAEQWPDRRMPDNAAAWLFTVAKRRLFDRFRKMALRKKEETHQAIYHSLYEQHAHELVNEDRQAEGDNEIPEERLRLIFTCCHPALSEEARVALTLKTLCGLTVKEIARAFLSSESAMEQRLTRAKRKIRVAGIAYEIPEGDALTARLPSVQSVIYLIYNESYSAYEGQTLTRDDFAVEAIRLARLLYALLPHSNNGGLLSLLLLHDSRRQARHCVAKGFVPLEEQDRRQWDTSLILEGVAPLEKSMTTGPADVYKIQAAISALHSQSPSWQATDWPQIALLYQSLYRLEPSPVVLLNQAVAVSHGGNPQGAYKLLEGIEEQLQNYQPFYAARAHINQQLDAPLLALQDYAKAIQLSKNTIERDYLEKQYLQLQAKLALQR